MFVLVFKTRHGFVLLVTASVQTLDRRERVKIKK